MLNDKICSFDNGNFKIEIKDNKVYVNSSLLKLLDKGVDGYIYKYKDMAIKLYRDDKLIKNHLTQEQVTILSLLTTHHIVLPKEKIIGDNNPGYIMKYINLKQKKDILFASKEHILNEIQDLEKELYLLGCNHFLLDDMQSSNLFYNGKLYMFDSDSFIYDSKVDFSRKNLEIFSWYFIRDIIFSLTDEKEKISLVRKLHFLNDIMLEENLYKFRKNFRNKK